MKEKQTLEQATARVEELLQLMNKKETPFDDLLKYYEEATKLLSFCYKEMNEKKGKFIELQKKIKENQFEGE